MTNVEIWRRAFIIAGVLAVLAGAWWFAEHIPRTLSIFVIAAFIAFGVQPIARRLERRLPKPLAIAIVFTGLLLVVAIGLTIFVPLTINQTQALVMNAPEYLSQMQTWVGGFESALNKRFPSLNLPTQINFSSIGSDQISAFVSGTISSLGTIVLSTATGFFIAFSSIILSFFFLLNDTKIAEGFAQMFPPGKRDTARSLAAEVTQVFGSYISGQVIVSAITGAVIALISALIGFKFWLLIGIISGVAYAIPVIGMLIAEVIAVGLCAPQGIWMVVYVQIIMFGMARISDNILVPKIMGDSVGVSPIGVMFASFAGGELFGIPGLILGIPAAALIKIVWRYFAGPWLHAQLDRSNLAAKPPASLPAAGNDG
jgi:predicted PurR-regulated permease PerM